MKVASVVLLIIGIWIGMVLGLSFIEAPLKFTAPGITTKLAIGIGRIVFEFSNKVQLVLLASVILSSIFGWINPKNVGIILLGVLTTVMLVQNFYLLPILGERVAQILEGKQVAPSPHHLYFIITEVMKLFLLVVLFFKLQAND